MPYGTRMWCIAVLMSAAYTTVALSKDRGWQLLGVVFSALQVRMPHSYCVGFEIAMQTPKHGQWHDSGSDFD